ncbi:MAG: hypothetical protein OEL19_09850 [Sulfurimonas sp.]|nr:hypothetical protein [Sulfurimonas sp.]
MLPFIIGGVALAATGYGIKRYIENEDNYEKIDEAFLRFNEKIDEYEERTNNFFDGLKVTIGKYFDEEEEEVRSHTPRVDLSEVLISLQNTESTNVVKKTKNEFYKNTLHELRAALGEIKNLSGAIYITPPEQMDENSDFLVLDDALKAKLDSFVTILKNVQSYIDANLDKLDAIIISSDDYTAYSDEDKRFVQTLLELHNIIEKVTNTTLTHDGETISREMQRAFGKIQNMIS